MMKYNRILILEDEQLAGEKLISYVRELLPSIAIEWRRSVVEGKQFLQSNTEIDLILSDIELLDGSSFEIYKEIEPPCPIIFCTAYNQYYMDAFETKGISYLLKPYSREQFQSAWKKYESLFGESIHSQVDANSIQQLTELLQQQGRKYKQTFTVKKKEGVFLLRTKEIVYFQAQGDFVLAYDAHYQKHILNDTLAGILAVLDPQHFFQINRSEIVQLDYIQKFEAYTKNRLAITTTLAEKLYTSNSRASEFRKWVDN